MESRVIGVEVVGSVMNSHWHQIVANAGVGATLPFRLIDMETVDYIIFCTRWFCAYMLCFTWTFIILDIYWQWIVCFSFRPEYRQFLLYARQIEIRGVDIDNPYYNYIISFTVPDIDNVTVVDYDALEHRIYWSDVRTQTIKRAFINGTGVETVVSAGEMIVWA